MEKINIAKLLKDCPKGMELYSPLCGDCKLYDVNDYNIRIETSNKDALICLYHDGRYCANGEIMLFPKGKTTWDRFVPPCQFNDGDVIYTYNFIAILSHIAESGVVWYHCYYCISTKNFNAKHYCGIGNINNDEFRFATEEEKEKLFKAIKDNGYQWDAETNTLEKLPIFKVGNKIKSKTSENIFTVIDIRDGVYILSHTDDKFGYHVPFRLEKDYELIPNKFDITTLKPFNKVLIRDRDTDEWNCNLFSYYRKNSDRPYVCIGYDGMNEYEQCIPYGENKHLLGKTDDCDEYFKTW